MMTSDIKILIIGQSGQIAPVVTEFISKNTLYNISTVSRSSFSSSSKCQHFQVDSYTIEHITHILDTVRPNYILYFLAAGSVKARPDSVETIKYINFTFLSSIWSWCNRAPYDVKLIYFSSTAIYKGLRSSSCIESSTEPSPSCDYSYYKVLSHENIVSSFNPANNAFPYQLILGSIIGGFEHSSRLIPRIISYLTSQSSFTLYRSHDKRDYISVLDVCFAVARLLSPSFQVDFPSNILAVSGESYDNLDIFNILSTCLKSQLSPPEILLEPQYYGESLQFNSDDFAFVLDRKPLSASNSFSTNVLDLFYL